MEFVRTEIKDYIATITLDNPPANAFNAQMYHEAGQAFNQLNDRIDEVRVAILTGEGKIFCGGNDINELDESSASEMNNASASFNECLTHVYNSPVPIIGAINGAAVGTGFCLAAVCDILVAAEQAKFGVTEIKVGILGGLAFLPLMVPQKVGKYMSLTGTLLSAKEMAHYGAVRSVVPREQLMEEAMKYASQLKQIPPLSLRAWKKAYNLVEHLRFVEIEHITDLFTEDLMKTEDSAEAMRAFIEKRPPVFKGR